MSYLDEIELEQNQILEEIEKAYENYSKKLEHKSNYSKKEINEIFKKHENEITKENVDKIVKNQIINEIKNKLIIEIKNIEENINNFHYYIENTKIEIEEPFKYNELEKLKEKKEKLYSITELNELKEIENELNDIKHNYIKNITKKFLTYNEILKLGIEISNIITQNFGFEIVQINEDKINLKLEIIYKNYKNEYIIVNMNENLKFSLDFSLNSNKKFVEERKRKIVEELNKKEKYKVKNIICVNNGTNKSNHKKEKKLTKKLTKSIDK